MNSLDFKLKIFRYFWFWTLNVQRIRNGIDTFLTCQTLNFKKNLDLDFDSRVCSLIRLWKKNASNKSRFRSFECLILRFSCFFEKPFSEFNILRSVRLSFKNFTTCYILISNFFVLPDFESKNASPRISIGNFYPVSFWIQKFLSFQKLNFNLAPPHAASKTFSSTTTFGLTTQKIFVN